MARQAPAWVLLALTGVAGSGTRAHGASGLATLWLGEDPTSARPTEQLCAAPTRRGRGRGSGPGRATSRARQAAREPNEGTAAPVLLGHGRRSAPTSRTRAPGDRARGRLATPANGALGSEPARTLGASLHEASSARPPVALGAGPPPHEARSVRPPGGARRGRPWTPRRGHQAERSFLQARARLAAWRRTTLATAGSLAPGGGWESLWCSTAAGGG
jgi:hypothetical protein